MWNTNFSIAKDSDRKSFSGLFKYLQSIGYDVIETAFLTQIQLRVGTTSAVSAIIKGDKFNIYKCVDIESAINVSSEFSSAFQIQNWVFRSIPVMMYRDTYYEIGELSDKDIAWSKLVKNKQFLSRIESYFQLD